MPGEIAVRYAFAAATAVFLLVAFHAIQRLFSPRHTLQGDAGGARLAYLLVQAGHLAAVLLLLPGVVQEAFTHEWLAGSALWAAVFGLAGVALIQLVGQLGIRLVLRATLARELEAGNKAAGVAAGANYVAVGILASPAIAGSLAYWPSAHRYSIATFRPSTKSDSRRPSRTAATRCAVSSGDLALR